MARLSRPTLRPVFRTPVRLSDFTSLAALARGGGGAAFRLPFATNGSTYPIYSAATGQNAYYDSARDETWITWEAWDTTALERQVHVVVYDHATERWGQEYTVATNPLVDDDHGVPSVCPTPGGRLAVFYGSHNNAQKWAINDVAGDPSAWTVQANIGGTSDDYTYPHPNLVGSTIYLFMRGGIDGQGDLTLRKIAFDGSDAPTVAAAIHVGDFDASSRWYQGNTLVVGTDIHMIATHADLSDTVRNDVYYLVYNTLTDEVHPYDSATESALPVDRTDLDATFRIYEHGASEQGNVPVMVHDSSGNPHVTVQNGATGVDVEHFYHDGSAWTTPESVATVQDRYGAAMLVPYSDGRMGLYYVRDTQGLGWTRGGDTLYKERTALGVWGAERVIRLADDYAMDCPGAVPDPHANLRVILYEVSQASATEEQNRLWAYGDEGFVPWPDGTAPVVPDAISDLVATAQSDTEVLLEFTDSVGATSHEYRIDGGSWVAMPGDFIVDGLIAETEYHFEVRGVNADGNSAASNVASATTLSAIIITLFASGEDGAVYDVSDLSTMFQDTAGTVPAAVDQPVARINDKSGNGNHAVQTTSTRRPILRLVGGHHALQFDGSDDALVAPVYPVTDASGRHSAAAGASVANVTGTKAILDGDNDDEARISQILRVSNATLQSVTFNAAVGAGTDAAPGTVSADVPFVASQITGDGVVEAFLNGAGNGSTAASGGTHLAGSTTLTIGYRTASPGGIPLAGMFYGGIQIARKFTVDERAAVEAWIAARAGVTL